MKCSRCGSKLIEGKNINRKWALPICKKCRNRMIDSGDPVLTDKENKIFRARRKIREKKEF